MTICKHLNGVLTELAPNAHWLFEDGKYIQCEGDWRDSTDYMYVCGDCGEVLKYSVMGHFPPNYIMTWLKYDLIGEI